MSAHMTDHELGEYLKQKLAEAREGGCLGVAIFAMTASAETSKEKIRKLQFRTSIRMNGTVAGTLAVAMGGLQGAIRDVEKKHPSLVKDKAFKALLCAINDAAVALSREVPE